MHKYITRRLLLFVPTLIGVSLAIFFLLRIIPGDVAHAVLAGPSGEGNYSEEDLVELRQRLGLDRPLYVQYGDLMWDLVRGDLGESVYGRRPIGAEIARQFPVTLQLGAFSILIVWMISIPIGVLAAVKQDSWPDYALRGLAVVGLAMPSFFVGLLIVLLLSMAFHWSPPPGFMSLWRSPIVSFQQLIFPALAIGFSSNGTMLRMMRTQLLEVLREDYVRTARAKGLPDRLVVSRHAVRNALLPVVTIGGGQVGAIFSGTVVIENIFNIPGIGRGLVEGMFQRDLPMVQAYVMYFAVVALAINLIIDIAYAWLDPRIRYS
jgi:peptide/nickel transport system permease protein